MKEKDNPLEDGILDELEKARNEYFFKMSQSRYLRRKMAKAMGVLGRWQEVKDQFPPYNKPYVLGVNKFKKALAKQELSASDKHKAVLQYKEKARSAFTKALKEE